MKQEGDLLDQAAAALRRGDMQQAQLRCQQALRAQPRRARGWLLAAKLAQASADYNSQCSAAARAAALEPGDIGIQLAYAEALVLAGQLARAKALVLAQEPLARAAADWAAIGQFYLSATDYSAALAAYRRAAALAPEDPAAQANLANILAVTGASGEAEQLLNGVLVQDPLDADSHYNRATLRRVGANDNHIAEMTRALRAGPADEAPLCYALAKEHEDCAEYALAWDYLQRGARARRARLSYRVARDEQTMADIARHFDAAWMQRQRRGDPEPGPIFVLGLPRSGTTLVERMLARHSQVASLGEINDLALALMRAAGPHANRSELIAQAAQADLAALGRDYRASTAQYGAQAPYLVDKTPLNLLYLGIIAAALPGARILHLRRHPVASCHALFKTLFRMACPFSYDLDDLARYYLAYHRLLTHWRQLLGADAWLDIDYESLVAAPEAGIRQVLDACGLPWEPDCLAFHANSAPVATASAAQVREPVHTRSVDLWRHYSAGLSPLIKQLQRAGIDCD
ncbi:sulfotransferase [Haliea sp. E1-2-M8]|uniref:tetratricopeptide repeat-containing sulfotransferase family protein n=1 Tax=Haliea sp. E1-2-M8 TaxID=3064706 RepID=UPI00271596CB|nr:sulfotransferase [Haliea sp. E1-2-M8]MDO8861600.1 sulfotransferase [Haliea sp. E1-2-M8]